MTQLVIYYNKVKTSKKGLAKLLFFILLFSSLGALAQPTTVWIVRHAEKDTTNLQDKNPGLSAQGIKRAADLADVLNSNRVDAVFTTPYKRTEQTGQAVAGRNKLQIIHYTPADTAGLARLVMTGFKGKAVLIVGHSNTVVPIANALGATTHLPPMSESDYDLLIKMMISADSKTTTTVSRYGQLHHQTELVPKQ